MSRSRRKKKTGISSSASASIPFEVGVGVRFVHTFALSVGWARYCYLFLPRLPRKPQAAAGRLSGRLRVTSINVDALDLNSERLKIFFSLKSSSLPPPFAFSTSPTFSRPPTCAFLFSRAPLSLSLSLSLFFSAL